MGNKALTISTWFLRIALAAAFLSAVADRFGLWGGPGADGIAWGNWYYFSLYAVELTRLLPSILHQPAAWIATAAEVVLAVGLLTGWKLRYFALASGVLLLIFALTMTLAFGIKSPLDYSVFTASAGAFLLAALPDAS
jgi:uncharacterized membrane protein YphA (DoxX/SURF4 family)